MLYRVQLRDTEEGVEVHVVAPVAETGPELSVYVFATGGVEQASDAKRILAWIKARHTAGPHRPGFVLHLGGREAPLAVHAGDGQMLGQFISELPQTCGCFGSWWGETRLHIDAVLRDYPGSPTTLFYFTGHAQDAPLEWDARSLLGALDRQQTMLANPGGTSIHLICSKTADAPFLSDARVRVSRLRKFLDNRTTDQAAADVSAIRRLIVTLKAKPDGKLPQVAKVQEPWEPVFDSDDKLMMEWCQDSSTGVLDTTRVCLLPSITADDVRGELQECADNN